MRVQLKKKVIGRSLLAFLAIAIALPSMAHNKVPTIAHAPAFDRYAIVDDHQQDERDLVVIDRATLRHFDDVSSIELPAESISSQLETRIRSITLTTDHASIDVFPVSQKLASGSLELFDENNLNEHRELGLKTRWAIGNVRARWYDPSTGSFLTPDPMGYTDSSNLYAFGAGDPVNQRDPTGNCLGLDKKKKPCSYYAGKLGDFVVDSMGLSQLPGTGITTVDSAMRKAVEAPVRLSMLPLQGTLATGDASGEYLYRMERSTFHGEAPIDPGNVDDQLLMLGVAGDVATFIAPFEMLQGEAPTFRAAKQKSVRRPPGPPAPPMSVAGALSLPGPNRGLVFVEENLGEPTSAAMRRARDFESGTSGAYSYTPTQNRVVPALRFDNPNGTNLVRFDGLEVGADVVNLIDSKTRVVPFDRRGVPFVSENVRKTLLARSTAIAQNPGFAGWIEVPDEAAAREARQVLRQLGINNLRVRIR